MLREYSCSDTDTNFGLDEPPQAAGGVHASERRRRWESAACGSVVPSPRRLFRAATLGVVSFAFALSLACAGEPQEQHGETHEAATSVAALTTPDEDCVGLVCPADKLKGVERAVVGGYSGSASVIGFYDTGKIASFVKNLVPRQIQERSFGIGLGDFDGDGQADYVMGGYSPTADTVVLNFNKKLGPGTFALPTPIGAPIAGSRVMDFAVADYDENGRLDFAVAEYDSGHVNVYLGNGDGTFSGPTSYPLNFRALGLDAEDLNGNGHADFVAVKYDRLDTVNWDREVEVFLGDGHGGFAHTTIKLDVAFDPTGGTAVSVGGATLSDFDADGKVDLVVNNYHYAGLPTRFSFYRGRGDGTFEPTPVDSGSGAGHHSAIDDGDFNHDGLRDFVGSTYEGGASVYLGAGDGTFTEFHTGSGLQWGNYSVSTLPFSFTAASCAVVECPANATEVGLTEQADVYAASSAGVCVLAGAGADTVYSGLGDSTVYGGEGDDVLTLAVGDNFVVPGPGRDTVSLGNGDDTLAIWDVCEVLGGETISMGLGENTLITPVPVDELIALGVTITGVTHVRVEQHSCRSECAAPSACTPVAATDITCDGIDDDCDASVDEDYPVADTTCGYGACAGTGTRTCVAGIETNSCAWGAPIAANDVTCDGVDDDCDQAVDEDFVARCDGGSVVACVDGAESQTPCSDGDACNGNESCDLGACVAGTAAVLDDGNPCTDDSCTPSVGVVHEPTLDGVSCEDGDACNGAETCFAGSCTAGVAPIADDNDPCTVDFCDPVLGVSNTVVAGLSCSDEDHCNGIEVCAEDGSCTPGVAPTVDDGNPCTIDDCHPEGLITHFNARFGTECSDDDACNGMETCGDGACLPGEAPMLDDGNPCTVDACDPTAGVTHGSAPAGTECTDGLVCNGAEQCDGAGTCVNASPGAIDDGNPCTTDACSEELGITHVPVDVDDTNPCTIDACGRFTGPTHVPVAEGIACSDGLVCNGDEVCDGAGLCLAPTSPEDDFNPCTIDACDEVLGVTHVPLASGTPCAPGGDFCGGSGNCDATGSCVVSNAGPVVSDGDPCTADLCDPSTGTVSHVASPAGTPCAVADSCFAEGSCNSDGLCVATPVDVDDGDPCTVDSCQPGMGPVHFASPPGTACGELAICIEGECQRAVSPLCSQICALISGTNVGRSRAPCADGAIESIHPGECVARCAEAGTTCAQSFYESLLRSCSEDGGVDSDGEPTEGGACDYCEAAQDLWSCTVCNSESPSPALAAALGSTSPCVEYNCGEDGEAVAGFLPAGTECSSLDQCSGTGLCDGAGQCESNNDGLAHDTPCVALDLTGTAGNGSNAGEPLWFPGTCGYSEYETPLGEAVCNPTWGAAPLSNDCLDVELGIVADEGAPCALGECFEAGTCDTMGRCIAAPLPTGSPCDDENVCNGTESCRLGACVNDPTGPLEVVVDDRNPCTEDLCDPVSGVVTHEARPRVPHATTTFPATAGRKNATRTASAWQQLHRRKLTTATLVPRIVVRCTQAFLTSRWSGPRVTMSRSAMVVRFAPLPPRASQAHRCR